jgi:hypothetical protein
LKNNYCNMRKFNQFKISLWYSLLWAISGKALCQLKCRCPVVTIA